MAAVFVDTCFYIAMLRRVDGLHARCIAFDREYRGSFVTSEFILIEVGNWLAQTSQRKIVAEFIGRLRTDPRTTVLDATPARISHGLALYAERPDKQWSLTDCISFRLMQDHAISDALTSDHHFTQAGFNAILADPDGC